MTVTTTGIQSTCHKCGGYLIPPQMWHGTVSPRMCTCATKYGQTTGWICPRCNKSNSPHKSTCDCIPTNPYQIT